MLWFLIKAQGDHAWNKLFYVFRINFYIAIVVYGVIADQVDRPTVFEVVCSISGYQQYQLTCEFDTCRVVWG